MTKKPTTKSLTEALTKIAKMDIGVSKEELLEMSGIDALDYVVTIADEALNPKAGPTALELTTKEVADFIMKDFKLAFAQNDEIGDALNAAGILSPAGKPWTRSNVSKIMAGVKELIVASVGGEAPVKNELIVDGGATIKADKIEAETIAPVHPAEAPVETVVTPLVSEATAEPEAAPEPAPAVSELATAETVTPKPETSPEDALLAELEELDDLEGLSAA
ncbi:hypothetical protein PXK56_18510 [Phaeobacter gallaeciensis]|uniref:hypothetical protein n=1 Tax=Phaeobacter gallaeciensis TaxID=60890 RepID=UPI002380382D|nr:hypothetical protein [Phaeobacter gallaeciensis]MDE4297180.1 hypothetical protein [Phaeobacter gallaeciensis]